MSHGHGHHGHHHDEEEAKGLDHFQQEHQEFLGKLGKFSSLGKVEKEAKQLFELFTKGFERCGEAAEKLHDVSDQLHNTHDRVNTQNVQVREAAAHKIQLRANINEGMERVVEMNSRQATKDERIADLNAKNEALQELLALGPGWTQEQDAQRNKLKEARDVVLGNVEAKTTSLNNLRSDHRKLMQLVEEHEEAGQRMKEEIDELLRKSALKKEEAREEHATKFALDERLQSLQSDVRQKRGDAEERLERVGLDTSDISAAEYELRRAKHQMEKYVNEYDSMFKRTQAVTNEIENQKLRNGRLREENGEKLTATTAKEIETTRTTKELSKVTKEIEAVEQTINQVEADKDRVEARLHDLRQQIESLSEHSIRSERKTREAHKKSLDEAKREKDVLGRKANASEKASSVMFDLMKMKENTRKNLCNEINSFGQSVREARDVIDSLIIARERFEKEAEATNQRFATTMEEVKLQEVQISDLQRKILEGGSKMKQQQNLYESVRSDRNLYSKSLIESQEEIAEMARQFRLKNLQIEQLKEEIQSKDSRLVKEHFSHHKVEKEKEQLKNELTKIKKQIVSSEQIIQNQQSEIQKLNQITQEADQERIRQGKEHQAIIGEKNILSAQLIKREAELANVYDKIKGHWSSLQHGEIKYQECLAEIDVLRDQIKTTKRSRDEMNTKETDIDGIRSANLQLERHVLHEQTKVAALEEEMDKPLNVHRWRLLESSEPQRFEMVKKIQTLQKRLIEKTEEVVEKDLLIQEKERLYVELKNILGRQPGPEVHEQLKSYQGNLKQKQAQMKAMGVELDMYKQQVEEFRSEIADASKQMGTIKTGWIRERMREYTGTQEQFDFEAMMDDMRQQQQQQQPQPPPPTQQMPVEVQSAGGFTGDPDT